jgi:hypothetical protein
MASSLETLLLCVCISVCVLVSVCWLLYICRSVDWSVVCFPIEQHSSSTVARGLRVSRPTRLSSRRTAAQPCRQERGPRTAAAPHLPEQPPAPQTRGNQCWPSADGPLTQPPRPTASRRPLGARRRRRRAGGQPRDQQRNQYWPSACCSPVALLARAWPSSTKASPWVAFAPASAHATKRWQCSAASIRACACSTFSLARRIRDAALTWRSWSSTIQSQVVCCIAISCWTRTIFRKSIFL